MHLPHLVDSQRISGRDTSDYIINRIPLRYQVQSPWQQDTHYTAVSSM